MAITTYAELQTAVANWLHRSDLTTIVPTFIDLAEARINGDLDARFQDKKVVISTVAGTETVSIPDDLINIRHISAETSYVQTLKYLAPDQFESQFPYTVSGVPNVYTVIGTNLYLAPIPDAAYDLDLVYKSRVPALSESATTNTLLTTYPNVYLYATLLESAPYLKDDARIQIWENQYKEAIQTVNAQDWYSGSTMYVKSDVRP